ncbi:hypothetical protein CF327_g5008 [Tilletia walkeri]|nr:hypothetical protein CF327_g5008 [Tilletia walkeri]
MFITRASREVDSAARGQYRSEQSFKAATKALVSEVRECAPNSDGARILSKTHWNQVKIQLKAVAKTFRERDEALLQQEQRLCNREQRISRQERNWDTKMEVLLKRQLLDRIEEARQLKAHLSTLEWASQARAELAEVKHKDRANQVSRPERYLSECDKTIQNMLEQQLSGRIDEARQFKAHLSNLGCAAQARAGLVGVKHRFNVSSSSIHEVLLPAMSSSVETDPYGAYDILDNLVPLSEFCKIPKLSSTMWSESIPRSEVALSHCFLAWRNALLSQLAHDPAAVAHLLGWEHDDDAEDSPCWYEEEDGDGDEDGVNQYVFTTSNVLRESGYESCGQKQKTSRYDAALDRKVAALLTLTIDRHLQILVTGPLSISGIWKGSIYFQVIDNYVNKWY